MSLHRQSRAWIALSAIACMFLLAEARAAAPGKVYVFNGRIVNVNAADRSFTFSGDGRSYVFYVTSDTRITWRDNKALSFSTLRAGQDAEVEMKLGPNGRGIASLVRLASPWTPGGTTNPPPVTGAMFASLWAATTYDGRRLSAAQIKPLVLSASWPKDSHRVIGYLKLNIGVFLLSVGSDGTVANVDVLQSIGHRGADNDMLKALSKWRFRPNSVKEVRVPSEYGFRR
ncbi:MAG TPA: TonB family protein [Chthoniobacterales bacterium]|nr:TonB family protein [Chthoniobacterales bacterium]